MRTKTRIWMSVRMVEAMAIRVARVVATVTMDADVTTTVVPLTVPHAATSNGASLVVL
jgi:hypothetical protein